MSNNIFDIDWLGKAKRNNLWWGWLLDAKDYGERFHGLQQINVQQQAQNVQNQHIDDINPVLGQNQQVQHVQNHNNNDDGSVQTQIVENLHVDTDAPQQTPMQKMQQQLLQQAQQQGTVGNVHNHPDVGQQQVEPQVQLKAETDWQEQALLMKNQNKSDNVVAIRR